MHQWVSPLTYQIVRLFNNVQEAATGLMTRINDAIQTFMEVLGRAGECGIQCIFGKIGDVVKSLPSIAERFGGFMVKLDAMVGPNATITIDSARLKRVLQSVYAITFGAYNDVMRMYTLTFETMTVTLPQLAVNISKTAILIIDAIQAIPDCPVAATFALITAKDNIQSYIALVLYLNVQFQEAFYISTGELPPWLRPTAEIPRILSEFGYYMLYHIEVLAWGCDGSSPSNPAACVVNRSLFDAEKAVKSQLAGLGPIQEIFDFVDETILPPIEIATKLYSDIQMAWDTMKRA
jgi:hypothetical protein